MIYTSIVTVFLKNTGFNGVLGGTMGTLGTIGTLGTGRFFGFAQDDREGTGFLFLLFFPEPAGFAEAGFDVLLLGFGEEGEEVNAGEILDAVYGYGVMG